VKRKLFALLLIASSFLAFAREPGDSKVVVQSGADKVVTFDSPKELTLQFWLQQLYLSALYRDVVQESTAAEWAQAMGSQKLIRRSFSRSVTLALPERQPLIFDEMLLPIPAQGGPPFAYLKHGAKYVRVAKYDPWVFEKLRYEAGLSGAEPTVPRGLF
jgi:hypothetical protein